MSLWAWTLGSVVGVSLLSFVGLVFMSRGRARLDALLMYLVSLAAGVLLGSALFHLLPEAYHTFGDAPAVPLLFLVGFLGFFFLERFLWAHHHGHGEEPFPGRDPDAPAYDGPVVPPLGPRRTPEEHRRAGQRRRAEKDAEGRAHHHGGGDGHSVGGSDPFRFRPVVVMSLVGDGLHNLIDGMIIAAAYTGGIGLGLVTTGAVALHELPQEAGEFGVLVRGGLSVRRALLLNFLSASMAIVGALVVLVLGSTFAGLAEGLVPLTAGTFVYIAAADLIPELHHHHDRRESVGHAVLLVSGVVLMFGLTVLRHP